MEKLQTDIIEAKKELALQTYLKEVAEAETETLKAEIEKLNKIINQFKQQLHKDTKEMSTQTDECHHQTTLNSEHSEQHHAKDSLVAPDLLENGIESLAETLRQTAETAVEDSGYVMDMESGMYYDYKSGYYYDPNTSLLYDPRSATYFYFNQETNSYEFHSKVDLSELSKSQMNQDDQKLAWEAKKKTKKKAKEKEKPKQLDDHIISSFAQLNINKSPLALGSDKANYDSAISPPPQPSCQPDDGDKASRHKKTKHRHKKHKRKRDDKEMESKREEAKGEDDYIVISDEELNDITEDGEIQREVEGNSRGEAMEVDVRETSGYNTSEDVVSKANGDMKGKGESTSIERKEEREGADSEMEEGEVEDTSDEEAICQSKDEEERKESAVKEEESSLDWSAVSSDEDDEGETDLETEEEEEEEDAIPPPVNPMDYPPCVRLIVTESECIPVGSLHIVTVTGGTIGREGSGHAVRLPEIAVSKQHAEISYCDQKRCYCLKDLGSQNGTLLNGQVIASGRTLGKALDLTHNDLLKIGTTTFEVHIHLGNWTCENCEPGLVQAKLISLLPEKAESLSETKEDKEKLRKRELKKMKKKYDLVGEEYKVKDGTADGRYVDRAEERRQMVGSDNPYQRDDMPASVDRAIDESNRGHQMLLKMGWKEGDSLGKGKKGLKEPIQVGVHSGKAGLGSVSAMPLDMALNRNKKISFSWTKAQQRFQQVDPLYQGEEAGVNQMAAVNFKMWIKGRTEKLGEVEESTESTSKETEAEIPKLKKVITKVDMFGDD